MADIGFWNYAQRDPSQLALVAPDGREWTRGELFALQNQIAHGLRALGPRARRRGRDRAAELRRVLSRSTSPARRPAGTWCRSTGTSRPPRSPTSCRTARRRRSSRTSASPTSCRAAADEIGFPADGPLRDRRDPRLPPVRRARARPARPRCPPSARAGAVMNYTSGTTGKPKGVRRPLAAARPRHDRDAVHGVPGDVRHQARGRERPHRAARRSTTPRCSCSASSSLHLGHPVVLMEKWTPEECLRLIEKLPRHHQPHGADAVPPHARAAATTCARSTTAARRARMVHAAAPCPPDVKRRMLDWWGDSIFEYYAATEGGGTLVTPQEWRKLPGHRRQGLARRRDQDLRRRRATSSRRRPAGHRLHAARPGRLRVQRTRRRRARTGSANYFTVGDVGYLNDDGYLFLCDRKIDMIISGGANIYPAEIENVLLTHPKVGDVAVFGIPNEDWGEEVKAVIEPAAGVAAGPALADEILALLRATSSRSSRRRRRIDFLAELPRDPERQAVQAQAARSVLGEPRARDLDAGRARRRRRDHAAPVPLRARDRRQGLEGARARSSRPTRASTTRSSAARSCASPSSGRGSRAR